MKTYTVKIKDSQDFWDDLKKIQAKLKLPYKAADFLRHEARHGKLKSPIRSGEVYCATEWDDTRFIGKILEISVTRYHTRELFDAFFGPDLRNIAPTIDYVYSRGLITAENFGHDLMHLETFGVCAGTNVTAVLAIGFDFVMEEE